MKKLILVLASAFLCASVFAQVHPDVLVESKGWHLYQNGIKMNSTQIKALLDEDCVQLYRDGKKDMIVGTACLPSGVVLGLSGLAFSGLSKRLKDSETTGPVESGAMTVTGIGFEVASYVLYASGAAAAVVGIVFLCTGSSKMNKVVKETNNRLNLTLEPASGGLGIALRF